MKRDGTKKTDNTFKRAYHPGAVTDKDPAYEAAKANAAQVGCYCATHEFYSCDYHQGFEDGYDVALMKHSKELSERIKTERMESYDCRRRDKESSGMRVNVDKPDEKDERISDWKPRYLVQKAPGVSGDLIQRDEPVLVIRAQDSLAGSMITYYLSLYEKLDNADPKVIEDMLDHQEALVEWQDHNRDRIKTADR